MLTAQELSKVLRDNGCKVTPQRLAIYDMLAHTVEHPNVETIYNTLKPEYPAMSLATVYKSVDVLSKLKVIQTLNVGEDSYRYDANVDTHPHMQCVKCGKVVDVPPVDMKFAVQGIEKTTGFEVTGQQLYFYGVCPNCKTKH